jgi:hypothetical protein
LESCPCCETFKKTQKAKCGNFTISPMKWTHKNFKLNTHPKKILDQKQTI